MKQAIAMTQIANNIIRVFHVAKSDWRALVPRINVQNGIKLGFVFE
jgi:hypothetical protein